MKIQNEASDLNLQFDSHICSVIYASNMKYSLISVFLFSFLILVTYV